MSDESTAAKFIESQNQRVSHARLPKPTLRDFIESQKKKRQLKPKRVKKRAFDPTSDNPLEHVEQATIIKLKLLYQRQIPALKNLFAIPNQGAARLKNLQTEGVLKGVSDLFLAWPIERLVQASPRFEELKMIHGLFIELKRVKRGKLSAEQIEFGARMQAAGYAFEVAYGAEDAWMKILKYLGVKDPR